MEFGWDDNKSEACFRQRGFDFAYAAHAFFDPDRLVHEDDRLNYGETRYQLMGEIEKRLFVVVFTYMGGFVRIISARKANQREKRQYEDSSNED